MTERSRPEIGIALDLGEMSGRDILSGIFRYLNEGHGWNVRIVGSGELSLGKDSFDGVIARVLSDAPVCRELVESPLPAVLITNPETNEIGSFRTVRTSFVRLDNAAVGRAAAAFFRSRGAFRASAFFTSNPERFWSRSRERGFAAESAGEVFHCHQADDLPAFLESLPKPAAVLAANDKDGRRLLEVCRARSIEVPAQVAVLGVDNDEFICGLSDMSLSSLHLAHQEVGYRAAKELAALLCGKGAGREIVVKNPIAEIVERDSTRVVPPAGRLIESALKLIRTEACAGLRACEVPVRLGVSRRLLDLRFRQIEGRSVLEAIQSVRLEEVKRRLRTTTETNARIARSCGYSSAARLEKIFKATFGVSLGEFRKSSVRAV